MKKRIIIWGILLGVAILYISAVNLIKNKMTEKKEAKETQFLVYNDVANDSTLKNVINNNLKLNKKIVFCNDSDDAEIVFTKNNEEINDELQLKTSLYTPLVICMKNSKILTEYQKNNLLTASEEITNSSNDEIKINFKKIIDAVLKEKKWSEFGGEEEDIRIFIPASDSVEYEIFKKFLITTINGGTYPLDEDKLDKATNTANEFLDSSNCVETENIYYQLNKINAINSSDIYILFEADLMSSSIWSQKKLDIAIAYPNVTLVKHMYIQVKSEDNSNLSIEELSKELNYRNSDTSFNKGEENIYNISDNFSFIEVEEEPEDSSGMFLTIFLVCILILFIVFCGAVILV